jgi:DNA-binding Lrp family transcriptional regulator
MDKLDKKILEQLILNSRIPIKKLAKNIGASREVVNYRINKLNKNLIKEYTTIINFKKLGYKKYTCFMKFKGISLEKEKEILTSLVKNELIMFLSPIIGKWNVAFDIITKDQKEVEETINKILSFCSDYLDTYVLLGTNIEEQTFPTKYIGIIETKKNIKKQSNYKLDQTDKRILELLSNNSRLSFIELSKKLNIIPNTIKYRLKNLEKTGVILGYSISIDFKKLDFELYNLQLKSNNFKNKRLQDFFKSHPKVVYYYKYLGNENWDIDIGLIIKDSIELREFIIDLRKNFKEVAIYEIYILTEIIKDYYPKGIFKN